MEKQPGVEGKKHVNSLLSNLSTDASANDAQAARFDTIRKKISRHCQTLRDSIGQLEEVQLLYAQQQSQVSESMINELQEKIEETQKKSDERFDEYWRVKRRIRAVTGQISRQEIRSDEVDLDSIKKESRDAREHAKDVERELEGYKKDLLWLTVVLPETLKDEKIITFIATTRAELKEREKEEKEFKTGYEHHVGMAELCRKQCHFLRIPTLNDISSCTNLGMIVKSRRFRRMAKKESLKPPRELKFHSYVSGDMRFEYDPPGSSREATLFPYSNCELNVGVAASF